jgi:L-histidine Nalpha-methyltransferase
MSSLAPAPATAAQFPAPIETHPESPLAAEPESPTHAVAQAARDGLTATPKTLPPWLFYDAAGSQLFEQITALPEYYLTRTERSIFAAHADTLFLSLSASSAQPVTVAELGAGTAAKTGLLLHALTRFQPHVLYQPIDISPTALDDACAALERSLPTVTVRPLAANYITQPFTLERLPGSSILALYIGSSIGNFSPAEARSILLNLRSQLEPGDALLLGTDLAPSPSKSIETLLAAYNDAAGVTAAFNRNILARLNRDLAADFDLTPVDESGPAVDSAAAGTLTPANGHARADQGAFRHRALWNPTHSRIEMHLEALRPQRVHIPANSAGPALTLHFAAGETIHTENSYKFTIAALSALLADSGFTATQLFTDPDRLFAVTLANVL